MISRKKLSSLWTISMSWRTALHFYSGKIGRLEGIKVIIPTAVSLWWSRRLFRWIWRGPKAVHCRFIAITCVFISHIASLTSKAPPSGRNIQLSQVFARLTRSKLPGETVWSKGAEQPAASRGSRPGCHRSVRWDLSSCIFLSWTRLFQTFNMSMFFIHWLSCRLIKLRN
jgi:hypothetical protein